MDVFALLGQVAPTLYKAVTGDVGGAVQEALKAFGIDSGSKDDLAAALKKMTPEQIAELKKADITYQQRLAELNVDLEKIFVDDRVSARNMYVQTRDWLVPSLAVLLIAGAFIITASLFFVNIPDSNKDTLFMVLGIVIGYAGNVVTFYFGSSDSSQSKNKAIQNLSEKL